MNPGSHEVAADIVGRALLDQGATNLQAKLGAFVASYGDTCFRSDVAAQDTLKRSDGRKYHRESIGRARRMMARRGWIQSTRVYPQQVPKGAKHPTTHGTTDKSIVWKTLGLRNPMSRGEKRERRKEQQRQERPLSAESSYTPRRRVALEPSFVALVGGIGSMPEPSTRAGLARPTERVARRQADLEDKAAQARKALEAWARENEERGPP